MEAVRNGMSILNLSNKWLEMEIETEDHREMDMMMDVTGAVLDVDKYAMSIGEEELMMDVLMKTLVTPLEGMDTNNNTGGRMTGGAEDEEWLEDTFFKELNFEDWVEEELMDMEVTKLVEPLETVKRDFWP